ncbi:MAG: hypothetical protein J0H41_16380 [Rhizobiales bacterium]|nr:hypothetical protein [Hyphomicrobiales bacterium]
MSDFRASSVRSPAGDSLRFSDDRGGFSARSRGAGGACSFNSAAKVRRSSSGRLLSSRARVGTLRLAERGASGGSDTRSADEEGLVEIMAAPTSKTLASGWKQITPDINVLQNERIACKTLARHFLPGCGRKRQTGGT